MLLYVLKAFGKEALDWLGCILDILLQIMGLGL